MSVATLTNVLYQRGKRRRSVDWRGVCGGYIYGAKLPGPIPRLCPVEPHITGNNYCRSVRGFQVEPKFLERDLEKQL
jgi:hypothetical protein